MQASKWVQTDPGVPVIRNVNWGGLKTLYVKEVRRFFKVQLQTVWGPAVTTLLFLAIFSIALGRSGSSWRWRTRVPSPISGAGLIVMGMIQNSFANASFSLLIGKIQGTIVDYLMPPLSSLELIAAMVGRRCRGRSCRVGGVAGDAAVAGRRRVAPASVGGDLVWPDGIGDARLLWAAHLDLGREVRPCRRGHQLLRGPARLAVGHLLFDRGAGARLSDDQPRQPLLLRHIGFSLRLPGGGGFTGPVRGALLLGINLVLGLLCFVLLNRGWKLKA
jgi:ABC-2 type transport system permease protein